MIFEEPCGALCEDAIIGSADGPVDSASIPT